MIATIERRLFPVQELRADRAEGKPTVLRGHAAVFDQLSEDLGGFREKIAPGAFASSLGGDIRALVSHDPAKVIGRTKAGTLRLKEDSHGLAVENDLPETSFARDLVVSIERGVMTSMSFGFSTRKDHWEKINGEWVRTLLDVELFEVSAVGFPAYPQTDVTVAKRSLEAVEAQRPPDDELDLRRRRLALAGVE